MFVYVFFSSSGKPLQGLKPAVSENCSLKLCLPEKFKIIGPHNQEINKKEEIDGFIFCIII